MQNKSFGVIGNPIAHSKSPQIHNFWLSELGINASYEKILAKDANDLAPIISRFDGLNITLPYKCEILKHADFISPEASACQAANTIVKKDGKIHAYNTDIFGFFEPIKNAGIKSALLIGAGGAARAVLYALQQANIATTVINRSPRDEFGAPVLNNPPQDDFELIINSTSSSLQNTLPIEPEQLARCARNARLAYDLAYSHDVFLSFCKRENPAIALQDGLDMLVYQAALSFKYFCGDLPEPELIHAAKKLLN